MISLEEVRQVVTAEFKNVHEAHSSLPVNYDNYSVVDPEHRKDPFIKFELRFLQTPRVALGERDLFVEGDLMITFYYREGSGGQGRLVYTDMLNENLGMKTLNGIYYGAFQPLTVITFPGWVGTMNKCRFVVSGELSC